MRAFMERLADVLARRRWVVVGAWLAVVVVALPLASKQTENLTGGGFDVPGSNRRMSRTRSAISRVRRTAR
jgi:uncharacterized membrane protein YdfJ with MMPL/SSD domain